ncbi:hypothetical protein PLICRDRAFT_576850 [Plicaturopsis crispa FD-325 SS-3]|nr:hypothetical protein PLICRDRAFT_576850 [Plicaturopsis crispa FD-325 SS-3]
MGMPLYPTLGTLRSEVVFPGVLRPRRACSMCTLRDTFSRIAQCFLLASRVHSSLRATSRHAKTCAAQGRTASRIVESVPFSFSIGCNVALPRQQGTCSSVDGSPPTVSAATSCIILPCPTLRVPSTLTARFRSCTAHRRLARQVARGISSLYFTDLPIPYIA